MRANTIERAVEVLNELRKLDPNAMARLVATRVPCGEGFAQHPTVQVLKTEHGYLVGLVGILNALFGDADTKVVATWDDLHEADDPDGLVGFDVARTVRR